MLKTRESGILAHITSLYSDYGIGDLGKTSFDFVDFLSKGDQRVWQILPINPTSFGDSPYQSFSTFAGNPLMICPIELAKMGLLSIEDIELDYIFPDRHVDYGLVFEFKEAIFRCAYKNFKDQGGYLSRKYLEFVDEAAFWLDDYALFVAIKWHFIDERRNFLPSNPEYKEFVQKNHKYLSKDEVADYFYGAVWLSWPEELRTYDKAALAFWGDSLADDIEYHKFLQYIFFKQFAAVCTYAAKNDVRIIGDIPIFVALDSADCWSAPHLFQLGKNGTPQAVAGVPPDYFSEDGQLWGNPLYDWEAHKADGYKWWISRLRWGLKHMDGLRIDHFIGFERNYAIAFGAQSAKNGKWQRGPSTDFFAAVQKALGDLPIIAEDLGVLTPAVEALRDKFSLPGMKVLQFGFDSLEDNPNLPHNFATPNCVVYSGTHDNNTSAGWYDEADEDLRDYFRRYASVSGNDAAWDMMRLAFLSIAKLAIVPIQDVCSLGAAYRMNRPGIASDNWQFRLRKDDLRDELADGLAYLARLSHRVAVGSVVK